MASSLPPLKRLVFSNLLPKPLLVARSAAQPASRLFNTNAARVSDSDDYECSVNGVRRWCNRPALRRVKFAPFSFLDAFDPFSTTRSLSQILNAMDQIMDSPLTAAATPGSGSPLRRGWDARETDDGLYLRVDMPGLGKESVKVSVEHNTLIIRGEAEKESGDEDAGRRYTSRIDLPERLYKTNEIKAEMKNGVLKVVVPKVKTEEKGADVFNVKVE
ncbi:heat shock 22 kDa protein, mitochondrial-like [Diospyros lotus]|uniref:heat shock 22 kDa protein, mitochondrial-like n=1 Tax=Diospyros lotus TaxID=55363 RepID=UPI00224D8266|nr:heat shock 22 kDa protein, mitochondrial-like [Diospyros lotus]